MIHLVQFVAILLAALSMGVHFGTWLLDKPIWETTSGAVFTEVHKGRHRVAARVMPVLGKAALLSVAVSVYLMRDDPAAFIVSLAGFALMVANLTVTLRGNNPINQQIDSWDTASPPSNWTQLRDRWQKLHSIRTAMAVAGFALFVASVVFFKT